MELELRQRADGACSIKFVGQNKLVAETRGQTAEENLALAEQLILLYNAQLGRSMS